MEQINKKERTKNFTEAEKMLLVELVQERCKILENKTTNNVFMKEKEDCWEDLQIKFMSCSKGGVRSVQALKTYWENIKKRTKKQYAEEKQAIYKTGGGQYKAINDPIAEKVREIIRPAVEGLSSVFDSDCITEQAYTTDNFNEKEEVQEEWLEDVIEDITEGDSGVPERDDVTERNKDGIERNEGGRKDNTDSEEDIVSNYLQNKNNWKNWNPQKLQTQISSPLRTSMNKRKSAASVSHSASTQNKKSKENDFVPSAFKKTDRKASNQLKEKNNNKNNNRFDTLADNKIELVNLMTDCGKEKHDFEIKILKKQLEKEELQIQVTQKELEIKTLILKKEREGFEVL